MYLPVLKTMLNAQGADGASEPNYVKDDRHICLEITMVGFTGTLNFVGSLQEAKPDFSSAPGATNPYDNMAFKDYQTGNVTAGDTGIAGTATTDVRIVEVNTNGLNWLGAKISSWNAGTISVKAIPFSNQ